MNGIEVRFTIRDAYECKFECVARKSPHSISELTNGQLSNRENEDTFRAAMQDK